MKMLIESFNRIYHIILIKSKMSKNAQENIIFFSSSHKSSENHKNVFCLIAFSQTIIGLVCAFDKLLLCFHSFISRAIHRKKDYLSIYLRSNFFNRHKFKKKVFDRMALSQFSSYIIYYLKFFPTQMHFNQKFNWFKWFHSTKFENKTKRFLKYAWKYFR